MATNWGRRMERAPCILSKRRPGELFEGDQDRNRVAGQPEEERIADVTKGEGLGRLNRHLPEVDMGVALQHHLGHVVVTHRYPAGGDDHIVPRQLG